MDLPNWQSLERVGRPDFRAATGILVLEDFIRHNRSLMLPEGRAVSTLETNYDARIFSGFDWTAAFSGAVGSRVMNRGVGLFPYLDPEDSTLKFPILFADEGADTISVDFSGATDPGTTDVWVRLVRTPATFGNRVFWNPSGAPAQETVDNIATRLTFQWEATIQDNGLPAPGTDWVKLWEVSISGGNFTGSVDFRHSYFEGSLNPTDAQAQEWGDGTNDRSTSRDLYPVSDWHQFAQLLRRQLADIVGDPVGAHTHFPAPAIELLQLANEHYGEADGAGQRGKHKDITLGATGRFWSAFTSGASAWETLVLEGTEESTDTPYFVLAIGDQGGVGERLGVLEMRPYGTSFSAPQNTGDYCAINFFGSAGGWEERVTAAASGFFLKEWKVAGTPVIEYDDDPSDRKLHVLLGNIECDDRIIAQDGFFIQNTQDVYLSIPWSAMTPDWTGAAWQLTGPNNGDPTGTTPTSISSIGAITGNKPVYVEFLDFPEDATLLAIDVSWEQVSTGAGTDMKMFAARYTATEARPADTHDVSVDYSLTPYGSQLALHSTTNAITYARNVTATQTRRFKPNQNNANWDRRKDKLVLGFLPPAGFSSQCNIHDIRTLWRYEEASPWTRTGGW